MIERSLEAEERAKIALYELADRLAHCAGRDELMSPKEQLARMTFGDS